MRRPSCRRTDIRKASLQASPCAKTHPLPRSTNSPPFGIVSKKKETGAGRRDVQCARRQTPSIEAAHSFAVGRQPAKVVMSRALLSEPGLIVADEPTQGVDVGARRGNLPDPA